VYLSLLEIAESFGVSERSVEEWIRRDGLPGIQDRGRWIFDRSLVVAWGAARGLGARAGFLSLSRRGAGGSVDLEPLLRRGGVWRDVPPGEVRRILEGIVLAMPGVSRTVAPLLSRLVNAPRGVTWAPVGHGLALPHLRAGAALGPDSGTLAVLLLSDALGEAPPSPDGVPVTRLWFFVAPTPRTHLDILGRLSRSLRDGPLHAAALGRVGDTEILAAVARMDSDDETRRAREP
jgi:nitrogen PTS system EIIA component